MLPCKLHQALPLSRLVSRIHRASRLTIMTNARRAQPLVPCSDKPLFLFSDIDDTMLGPDADSDAATQRFAQTWANNHKGSSWWLVYNTGRSLESYQDIHARKDGIMLDPHALICGVGTRIYRPDPHIPGGWCEDQGWTQRISERWDVEVVKGQLDQLINKHGEDRLQYADATEQHSHKQTVRVSPDLQHHVVDQLQQKLQAAGLDIFLVAGPTLEERWGFIDVLPAAAGKGPATEYLRAQLDAAYHHVVVAGDSPNDMSMLSDPRWNAIVVGNAQESVRCWAEQQLSNGHKRSGRLVLARERTADGLLEGLLELGFLQQKIAEQ